MNIKFLKIKIENFLSIGSAVIDLDRSGYTLVKGINNNPNDLAKSNGSGKSSIWEAISWCLTGETIRGVKSDISNIHTNDGALVELDFECDGKSYKLIRSKDNKKFKTNLKIFINDEDKSGKGIRDSEKLLAQYLPDLTSSLIGSVIILGQGLPQRFSNNSPSGRKEVLEKLSKSDFMIEDLKARLVKRKSELSKKLSAVHDQIVADSSKVSYIKSKLEKTKYQLSNIGSTEAYEQSLNDYKLKLNEKIKEISDLNESIEILEKEADEFRSQYTVVVSEKNKKLMSINTQYNDKKMQAYQELLTAQTAIKTAQAEIKRLDNVQDVCPTCGQKLQGVHKIDTTDLKNKLIEMKENEKVLNSAYAKLNAEIDTKVKEINNEYDDKLNTITHDGRERTSKISTYKMSVTSNMSLKESIASQITVFQNKINNFMTEKETLENTINTCKQEITTISSKILYNNSIEEDLQQRQDILNKFNSVITRDFRGYLLRNVIDYINKRAKYYSEYIFETDKIEFCLDGNNINISYDDKQYENLSGGEKQKVDLIVQFSIKDMLCSFLNFSSNILVVDEIFDNLDSIGCQKVVNLISTKLHDIKSVYVVTHRGDLDIPVDYELVVVKNENGISDVINGCI